MFNCYNGHMVNNNNKNYIISKYLFSLWSDNSINKTSGGDSSGRYSGLDFQEDPFQNADVRYADPFGMDSNSDPFAAVSKPADPFTNSASNVFGSDPFSSAATTSDPFGGPDTAGNSSDPFGGASTVPTDAFGSSSSDLFSGKPAVSSPTFSSSDPFSSRPTSNTNSSHAAFGASKPDPFSPTHSGASVDPFGSKPASNNNTMDNYSNDPFGNSFSGSAFSSSSSAFGSSSISNSNFNSSSNDPFRNI